MERVDLATLSRNKEGVVSKSEWNSTLQFSDWLDYTEHSQT